MTIPFNALVPRDGAADVRAAIGRGQAGLAPRLAGRGVVTAQDPMAGTPLDSGAPVRLWLDRDAQLIEMA